jgi:hypothetical protein
VFAVRDDLVPMEPGDERNYDGPVRRSSPAHSGPARGGDPSRHPDRTFRRLRWRLPAQLGFAPFLNDDSWARVGPILTSAATLVAACFGYVWWHCFAGK